MKEPAVRVSLTLEDLRFIEDSIDENIPTDDERTDLERKTSNKIRAALVKAGRIGGAS